jgi:coenzyme F420 biosynthesis associated uncharacterized protein
VDPRPAVDVLVDWERARSTAVRAVRLGGTGPTLSPGQAADVVRDLRERAVDARGHVEAATGLTAVEPATVRVVDREAWVQQTLVGTRALMTPMARALAARVGERSGATAAIGRQVLGAELGALMGLLAGRVLGQYEPVSGQLLLVAPNIVAAERDMSVPVEQFRTWVCLHEQTHALQFTGVPWLREHFFSLLDQLAMSMEIGVDPRALLARAREALRSDGGLPLFATLLAGPQQHAVLLRIQALMTVLEGYAEHVMDVAGEPLLPALGQLREQLEARRRSPGGPLTWVLRRVLGMDAKLAQYAQGKDFCDAVARRSGTHGLGTLWESPQTLPDQVELGEPMAWLSRVLATHAPA